MKRSFLKVESLLIIIPLTLFFIGKIFNKDSSVDFHLHDTYFVIDSTTAFIPVFLVMVILYSLHVVLRATGKWSGVFCKIHIYGSVFLYLLIDILSGWVSYSGLAGAPRRYYDISIWESFSYYSNIALAIAITFIVFLLLQLIFLAYFIFRLLKKAK